MRAALALIFATVLFASRDTCAQEPAAPAPNPPQAPSAADVNRAIARGVAQLYTIEKPDGTWAGHEAHGGGLTALCTLALVKSGVRQSDSHVQRALAAVLRAEFKTVYGSSVLLMLAEALRQPKVWPEKTRAALDLLATTQNRRGELRGAWGYPSEPFDSSNTQFALLGLRAAKHLGFEVPVEVLECAAEGLWSFQRENAGFRYIADSEIRAGVTAATLGGLEILGELAADAPAVKPVLKKHERERAAAEAWLARHFDPARPAYGEHAWTPTFGYAFLWAVERWGSLSGRAQLGEHDWYNEGARYLLDVQHADGGFGRGPEDTCFALLFLRRATLTPNNVEEPDLAPSSETAARPSTAIAPAADALALVDWWLAGPFQGKPGNTILDAPPFDPAKLRAKEHAKLAQKPFERIALAADKWIDLEPLTGRGGDSLLWALATNIEYAPPEGAKAEPIDVVVWLTVEDGCSVWCDGEERYASARVQAPIEEDQHVALTLAPGVHQLALLLEDDRGASAVRVRMTASDGSRPPASIAAWAVPIKRVR